jgi:hypothetical protein
MKKHLSTLCFLLLLPTLAQLQSLTYPVQPVPFTQVKISDRFWLPRVETVKNITIPYAFDQCEKTGRIKNFEIAGGQQTGSFCSQYAFDDSDVYKVIEGAAYSLHVRPDTALEAYVDRLIDKIAAAQEPDGYLYTWRSIYDREKAAGAVKEATESQFHRGSDTRWEREDQHSHELYNAGHLYEAAVAYYQASGKRKLLDVALRNADLVDKNFGWGKLEKATGHQEIEIGLVKLFQLTGERRYLDLAKFFLDVRGYGEAYMQNHQKVKDQREIAGHAVRACYMYAAMGDVTACTGGEEYMPALTALWEDVVGRKMYLTGGIGSAGSNEGFTEAYDLPNYSAYCETCASIAFVLWNQRMFQLTAHGQYLDVLERTLYNALNAGLSLTGDRFFYPNPLESRQNVERSPWFGCACCPSNVARFFPSLPGYIYGKRGNELYVNLYISSETRVENVNSKLQIVPVSISQETNYPWDGKVNITVNPEKPNTFTLRLRIPGWARGDAVPMDLYSFQNRPDNPIFLKVNGKVEQVDVRNGYASIERKWKKGDQVELALPMPVRKVVANKLVVADEGRLALQRGPLVYCLEGRDQSDPRVHNLLLSPEAAASVQFETGIAGGVQTLALEGALVKKKITADSAELLKLRLKAIPYYAWANRGKDNMAVWIPWELRVARAIAQPTLASKGKVSASEGVQGALAGISDQFLPENSADQESTFVHWWPRFGETQWLQYEFEQPQEVGAARVYWFDDEALGGGCRVPESWRVLYLENGEWKPVFHEVRASIEKDTWNTLYFEPVRTTALRLEFTARPGVSAGVQEWELR